MLKKIILKKFLGKGDTMFKLFPAVFESVWKRKETKLFLMFSSYSILYLLGSFFGSSNFMKISVVPGYELSYLSFFGMMISSAESFILPTIAMCFLIISVFKKEIDDHTMFLYKDLNKNDIFGAKYLSLIIIVSIYFTLSALVSLGVYYGRVAYMDIGANIFFDQTLELSLHSLTSLFSLFMKSLFAVTLGTFACIHFKNGTTLLISIISTIVMMFASVMGGYFSLVFPNGYIRLVEEGSLGIAVSFIGPIGIVLIYTVVLNYFSSKKFSSLEF